MPELLAAWADWLLAQGRVVRPGFTYDPRRHLPASAVDCLTAALFLAPDNLSFMRALEQALRGLRGAEHARLGFLSALALAAPEDWSVHYSLGLAGLSVFRPDEGLADLAQALSLAQSQGREPEFWAALAGDDPRGLLKKALREGAARATSGALDPAP